MQKNRIDYGYQVVLGGLLLALALVFPMFFHVLGLGRVFLPLPLPVAVAGFLLSLPVAVTVGLLAPLISALLTGMPPFYPPMAPMMMAEGLVLTVIPALFYHKLRWNLWLVLIPTLLADRLLVWFAATLLVPWLKLPPGFLPVAAVLQSLPGVILMAILVPLVTLMLEARKKRLSIYR